MEAGAPEALKEAMKIPNVNLWKMSDISEVSNFLSRKAWIRTKRIVVEAKGRIPNPLSGYSILRKRLTF